MVNHIPSNVDEYSFGKGETSVDVTIMHGDMIYIQFDKKKIDWLLFNLNPQSRPTFQERKHASNSKEKEC